MEFNLTPDDNLEAARGILDALSLNLSGVTPLSSLAIEGLPPGFVTTDGYRLEQKLVAEQIRQADVENKQRQRISDLRKSLTEFGASHGISYATYGGEHHLYEIMNLIVKDLSEPYSIYTYRYFIYQWPRLCHLALDEAGKVVGAIVCKMENTKGQLGRSDVVRRGYIAMLAVNQEQRRKKIGITRTGIDDDAIHFQSSKDVLHAPHVFCFSGTALVVSAVESLMNNACDEVVLETEVTNQAALKLYENLGFARHKRLFKYYLNGVDAFRLKLWLKYPAIVKERAQNDLTEAAHGDGTGTRLTGNGCLDS